MAIAALSHHRSYTPLYRRCWSLSKGQAHQCCLIFLTVLNSGEEEKTYLRLNYDEEENSYPPSSKLHTDIEGPHVFDEVSLAVSCVPFARPPHPCHVAP
mmetsp:Transcript_2195/g.3631  ORF Transcript_2195/g.3631 Transcript_2195/m.3631 type:complete len:99 (-) Transcript_2195:51-347(-)